MCALIVTSWTGKVVQHYEGLQNKYIFQFYVYFELWELIVKMYYLLRLRSSLVIDTLGHVSMPIFSVGCIFFSRAIPMILKSWCVVSVQFFLGLFSKMYSD